VETTLQEWTGEGKTWCGQADLPKQAKRLGIIESVQFTRADILAGF